MALTLIATPGASNANSYCTLEESNAYHEAHVYGDSWVNGDEDANTRALIWATRLLDEQMDWKGYPTSTTQALRWPRIQVLDRDGHLYLPQDAIPTFLKQATAELARYLLAEDRTTERGFGITSVTADTVSVDFDNHDVRPVLPASVLSIVSSYGMSTGPGGGIAKLVRV
jgi:hypothetical protein